MKIYTRQGDQGNSGLFDGRRVPKNHLRLETYGTLDELNSHLGLAIAECRHETLRSALETLQRELFLLGTDLATPLGSPNEAKVHRTSTQDVRMLEERIDAATAQLPPLKRFILPGGGVTACRLHVARTVCRRAERSLVSLMRIEPEEPIGHPPLIYVNRLRDLLFTYARLANQLDGIPDVEWVTEK